MSFGNGFVVNNDHFFFDRNLEENNFVMQFSQTWPWMGYGAPPTAEIIGRGETAGSEVPIDEKRCFVTQKSLPGIRSTT